MPFDGKFKVRFTSPMGEHKGFVTFETKDGAVTGIASTGGNDEPIRDVKVNGNEIKFVMDAKTPMGKMKATVNAAVDGDKISGSIKILMGSASFEGERVSE